MAGWSAALAACTLLLGACSSIRQTGMPVLTSQDSVAVVSLANFTETPAAGGSASAIAANVLRANGFADVRLAPVDGANTAMFDTARSNSAGRAISTSSTC